VRNETSEDRAAEAAPPVKNQPYNVIVRRLLLYAVTVLALLLAVTFAAVWVRGHYAFEGWVLGFERHVWHVNSARDGTYLAWFSDLTTSVRTRFVHDRPSDCRGMFPGGGEGGGGTLGFRYVRRDYGPGTPFGTFRACYVPHWASLALFSVVGAGGAALIRVDRRRRGLGLCPTCGYDLRATPDRCPECGHSPDRPAPAAKI
jgi:hypothetical protein